MADANYIAHNDESPLSGYLYKKTRDNRWQKRWFETNGVYLTYYKSRKMEKLLAALSLPQVGDIRIVPPEEDPEHQVGLFTLELNTRIYTLRSKSQEEALLWVTTLNRLRTEGINASQQQQQKTITSESKPQQNSANGKPKTEPSSEWMKSGKSCFGCC